MSLERTMCQLCRLRPLFVQNLIVCSQHNPWIRAYAKLTSCPGRNLTKCPKEPKPPKNILARMARKRTECIIPASREEYTCADPLVRCCAPTCPPPCDGFPPPIDLKMYKPHDRRKAKYQRTWNECKIVDKKCRRPCKIIKRKIPRRPRKKLAKPSACSLVEGECVPKLMTKCPKITLPGCGPVRSSLICKQPRDKDDCIRRQTRYPSYSECLRDPDKPAKNVECFCTQLPPMCLVWREYRKRIKYNLHGMYCDPKKFK